MRRRVAWNLTVNQYFSIPLSCKSLPLGYLRAVTTFLGILYLLQFIGMMSPDEAQDISPEYIAVTAILAALCLALACLFMWHPCTRRASHNRAQEILQIVLASHRLKPRAAEHCRRAVQHYTSEKSTAVVEVSAKHNANETELSPIMATLAAADDDDYYYFSEDEDLEPIDVV